MQKPNEDDFFTHNVNAKPVLPQSDPIYGVVTLQLFEVPYLT